MADHDAMIAQLEGMKGKGKKAPAKKTGGKRESAKAVMTGKGKVGIAGNPAAVEETKEDVEEANAGGGQGKGPEECPTCGHHNPAGTIAHRLANLKAKAEIAQALAEEARRAAEAIEASNAAVRANRDKVLGEWSRGIQEQGEKNREAYRNAPAKKAKAEDSESEEEGEKSGSDEEEEAPKNDGGAKLSYSEAYKQWLVINKEWKALDPAKVGRENYSKMVSEIHEKKDAIVQHIDLSTKPKEGKPEMPDFIAKLKVGDTIEAGKSGYYMGDGGDDRDAAGYSLDFKISSIPRKGTYITTGGRKDGRKFLITTDRQWLNDAEHYLQVTRVAGHRKPEPKPKETSEEQQRFDWEIQFQEDQKVHRAHMDEVRANYMLASKKELVNIIEKHFSAQGKRLTNLKTSTLPHLREVIKKYKILPEPPAGK